MKKYLFALCLFLTVESVFAQVPTQYIRDVERISNQYSSDMKLFLRSLDPNISEFNQNQKNQYCAIVKNYVDEIYLTTDQNRQYLPFSEQSITKQNIIDKVMLSPEMQLLKRYNIQCDLK